MIPAGRHGGEGFRLGRAAGVDPGDVLDLSASLNPVAPDVRPLVQRHLDALRRYPDTSEATDALARVLGVDAARVVLTNGGSEAIALLADELGGQVDEPEFSLLPRGGGPRWRSDPNNPTGRLAPPGAEADVWDEAFWPLATGTWTSGRADRGAWVVGSLTKLFACPGLRVGFVLAPSAEGANPIRSRQPEWSVNGLACDTLPELLDTADLCGWSKAIAALRTELAGILAGAGFAVAPSDACWLLVDAPELRAALARHAIAVRDCSSFGLPTHVRIAVPDEPGLERLARALAR